MNNQRTPACGAVLIIVLWFLVIATLLVTTVAIEVRLSAKIVFNQKQALSDWAEVQRAFHAAQMELMLQRMPPSPEELEIPLPERENHLNRFDGRVLTTSYPVPEHIKIRIYDHAGKINLQYLSAGHFRDLMKILVGDEPAKLDALYDAWRDWIDADDLKLLNGAEKDYYKTLSPPYAPRNAPPESVQELLLIKGFAEAFVDLDVEEVFTVYENRPNVNPNLATRNTLSLLPGMTGSNLDGVINARGEDAFKNARDLDPLMPSEQLQQLMPWLQFANGTVYTITIETTHPPPDETETVENATPVTPDDTLAKSSEATQVYSAVVQLNRGYGAPPRVLMVNPHARAMR